MYLAMFGVFYIGWLIHCRSQNKTRLHYYSNRFKLLHLLCDVRYLLTLG